MSVNRLPSATAAGQIPRLPRGITTLAFSWMHGRIAAVAVQRGEVIGTWSQDDAPDDLGRLGEYVREAARATEYRGSTVSLMLSHPRLSHQLIETAPAKGHTLEGMVARQVDRMKTFEGPAAFSFETTAGSQNPQSVLVHLLPQAQLDQLVRSTERSGLHLVSVLPPTAVLHGQLTRLPIPDDEVALIAADCGDRMTVVVGRKDGQLLLARSLDINRSKGISGLAIDLSRTLLFVSQQFGVAASSVWLFGPGAAERAAELQPQLQAPVHVSEESDSPAYWAIESLRLPPEYCPNLIGAELRLAPQRQALLRVTTTVSLVLLCAATSWFLYVEYLSARERSTIKRLEGELTRLQGEHLALQQAHELLAKQEATVRLVMDDRLQPVPAYFLAYIGQVIPPDLRLAEIGVKREGNLWHLRLTGSSQAITNTRPGLDISASVTALSKALASGPFHVRLAANTQPPARPPTASEATLGAFATWAARKTTAQSPANAVNRDRFVLEGWMK